MFILFGGVKKIVSRGQTSTSKDGEKRDRIIEAAVKVFAKKGFHHSRIAEIAETAGVASGTIYLYFKNKDDILISVFEQSLDSIIEEMKLELERLDDPREKLRRFIERHLDLLRRHKELAEVLQVELRQSHKFMKEYEPTRWVQYLDIIARILKEGQMKGVFRKDLSLGIFKRAVFGALDEIALHWVVTGKNENFLELASAQLSEIVLGGVAVNGRGEAEARPRKPAPSRKGARS